MRNRGVPETILAESSSKKTPERVSPLYLLMSRDAFKSSIDAATGMLNSVIFVGDQNRSIVGRRHAILVEGRIGLSEVEDAEEVE